MLSIWSIFCWSKWFFKSDCWNFNWCLCDVNLNCCFCGISWQLLALSIVDLNNSLRELPEIFSWCFCNINFNCCFDNINFNCCFYNISWQLLSQSVAAVLQFTNHALLSTIWIHECFVLMFSYSCDYSNWLSILIAIYNMP